MVKRKECSAVISLLSWLVIPVGLAGCTSAPAQTPERFAIVPDRGDPSRISVEVGGEMAERLRGHLAGEASGDRLDEVLSLRVRGKVGSKAAPLLARVEWDGERAVLTPQVPLTRGITYEAMLAKSQLSPGAADVTTQYTVPPDAGVAVARVVGIWPSDEELPANLLKLYVRFNRPMAQGHAFKQVTLLDAQGTAIDQAFHEVELWDEEHRQLTLLINPGRTKRHLGLSEALGPVLVPGEQYRLRVAAGLPDQRGRPMIRPFEFKFQTIGADHGQPDIGAWKVTHPLHAGQAPLAVRFDEPLDPSIARRSVRVVGPNGSTLAGEVAISADGREWRVKPEHPWQPGAYRLVAEGDVEDRAGNSLARRFETHAEGERPRTESARFTIQFAIR